MARADLDRDDQHGLSRESSLSSLGGSSRSCSPWRSWGVLRFHPGPGIRVPLLQGRVLMPGAGAPPPLPSPPLTDGEVVPETGPAFAASWEAGAVSAHPEP